MEKSNRTRTEHDNGMTSEHGDTFHKPPPVEGVPPGQRFVIGHVLNQLAVDLDPVAVDLDLVVVDLEHKEVFRRQDKQSLVGGPEAQHQVGGVQGGYLLLGDLAHLAPLLAVEEHRVHGGRLAVDERAVDTLAQCRVREVGRARRELFLPFRCLDIT